MPNCYDKIPGFDQLIMHYFNYDPNKVDRKNDVKVICPFPDHDDKDASFSINIETGVYGCFGCQKKGNIITLVQLMENISSGRKADEWILKYYGYSKEDLRPKKKKINPIDEGVINGFINTLNNERSDLRERMKNDWGINDDTINRLRIGSDGDRIAIPVKDLEGRIMNVRKYKFDTSGKDKVISYAEGYGQSRLWPIEHVMSDNDEIWICEGEKDCIVAISKGFNAVTNTTGAGTFNKEWAPLFKDKKVHVVYDNDKAGAMGSKKIYETLTGFAEFIKKIDLDVENEKEDLTDYFTKYNKTADDLRKLADEARVDREYGEIDTSVYQRVHLSQASKSKYYNKAIEMDCSVTGKQKMPHMPPKVIRIVCPGGLDKCKYCKVANAGGEYTYNYQYNYGKILNLINCSDTQQNGWIKKDVGIPEKCKVKIEKPETFNIEEVQLSPKLEISDTNFPHVNVMAYYIGHGLLTNKTYTMRGYTVPSPKDNLATHVILDAIPDQASISDFYLTEDDKKELEIFKAQANPSDPLDITSIKDRMSDIVKQFQDGMIFIYGRDYLYEAVDLVFHSPQSFVFNNKNHDKGWLDILILGDPRTGKNQVVEGMMKYYGMSSKASGESLTFAGLVGAVSGPKENQFIKWGLLPQNDKGFLLLDEVSGINYSLIGSLSSLRHNGECSIIKCEGDKTTARTRLIWLSNCRDGGNVAETAYGVQQIKDLIGSKEDIARFDFALVLSNQDVDHNLINAYHDEAPAITYPKEACRKLIQWAWSRRKSEIVFDRNAIKICLEYAKTIGSIYSDTIPLVQGEDVRFKIAKIAASYAARTFNTIDGVNLLVEPRHIVMAYEFLKKIYNHKSMQYDKFSATERMNLTITNEPKLREMMDQFDRIGIQDVFIRKMLSSENELFTLMDIQVLLYDVEPNMNDWTARTVLSVLSKANAIVRTAKGYKKTIGFKNWLNDYREGL